MAELYADLPTQSPGLRQSGRNIYYDRRTARNLQEWMNKIDKSSVVYVGNLNFSTTEDELYELFSQAGLVRRVVMGLNKHTREPCGFAFVEYFHAYEAKNAIILLNGASCDGRVVRVDADSGESIEDDRKFGRGYTGRQWRDEYREEYDVGRGGEGRKKRSRTELEEAPLDRGQQDPSFFHSEGAAMNSSYFPLPIAAAVAAAPAPYCLVPPPPPPPPASVAAGAEASAIAAAAALDAAVAEEAYLWQRNLRARKQLRTSTTTAATSMTTTPDTGGGGTTLLPPAYHLYSQEQVQMVQATQASAPNSLPHHSSDIYQHNNYLELVQRAQQQHTVNPFAATGAPTGSFMSRGRGRAPGPNAARGRYQSGSRNRT